MQALTRAASLLRRAVGSASTTAALHHPPPGIAPCLAKVCCYSNAGEKVTFITVDELNTAVSNMKKKNAESICDLKNIFQKSLLEQEISMNMVMVELKCDMEKDTDDNHNKYCLEHTNAKNELKLLREKFESYMIDISYTLTQGTIVKFKNYGKH